MKTQNHREIEKKFILLPDRGPDPSTIGDLIPGHKSIEGKSTDYFWNTSHNRDTAFVRLRWDDLNKYGQLTVKNKDRGDNVNRSEINVTVKAEEYETTKAFCESAFGPCQGELEKKYTVYFTADGSEVSVYSVDDREVKFLEVESKSLTMVNYWCNILEEKYGLVQETRSLYEMFIKPKSNFQRRTSNAIKRLAANRQPAE